MFALHGLIGGPAHVSGLCDLEHLLAVDLHLVELVRVAPVDGVGRRPVILGARVEVRPMSDLGLDESRLGLLVVGREDLCEGIKDLDTTAETETLIDSAIECH